MSLWSKGFHQYEGATSREFSSDALLSADDDVENDHKINFMPSCLMIGEAYT